MTTCPNGYVLSSWIDIITGERLVWGLVVKFTIVSSLMLPNWACLFNPRVL
jgi:hypothetical protein